MSKVKYLILLVLLIGLGLGLRHIINEGPALRCEAIANDLKDREIEIALNTYSYMGSSHYSLYQLKKDMCMIGVENMNDIDKLHFVLMGLVE